MVHDLKHGGPQAAIGLNGQRFIDCFLVHEVQCEYVSRKPLFLYCWLASKLQAEARPVSVPAIPLSQRFGLYSSHLLDGKFSPSQIQGLSHKLAQGCGVHLRL